MKTKEILKKINQDTQVYKRRIIIICVIVIFYLIGRLQPTTIPEINNFADAVSNFYSIPKEILPAIIRVESDYQQNAISHKNAMGLMQVTRPAFKDYLKRNPSTPYTNFESVKTNWKANISVGAWYLVKVCHAEKGNWKDAISAYFWGANHPAPTLCYYKKVKKEML